MSTSGEAAASSNTCPSTISPTALTVRPLTYRANTAATSSFLFTPAPSRAACTSGCHRRTCPAFGLKTENRRLPREVESTTETSSPKTPDLRSVRRMKSSFVPSRRQCRFSNCDMLFHSLTGGTGPSNGSLPGNDGAKMPRSAAACTVRPMRCSSSIGVACHRVLEFLTPGSGTVQNVILLREVVLRQSRAAAEDLSKGVRRRLEAGLKFTPERFRAGRE